MKKLLYTALFLVLFTPLTFAESPKGSDDISPECQKAIAEMKEAQAQHKTDYDAKGKAFFTWRKYFNELHSDSYLNTDEPLINSVEKCESGDGPGKDFCKGVSKKYAEISPKEKAAKEALDKAKEKSLESRKNYNAKLRQAADLNCVMIKK